VAIFGDTTATEEARDVFHTTVVTLTDDLAVPCCSSKNSPFPGEDRHHTPIPPQNPSLTTIILPAPPETSFSGVFLGINVSSRPVLTRLKSPSCYVDTYTTRISGWNGALTLSSWAEVAVMGSGEDGGAVLWSIGRGEETSQAIQKLS